MRRRIRLAVVAVALVASAVAAVPASAAVPSGSPSGKPVLGATGKPSPGPDDPKLSDEQLRKLKQQQAGRPGKHRSGLNDAQLADLARRLGVSKFRLVRALTHAKTATVDPRRLSPAVVRAFASELRLSRAQARKVLEFVFTAPAKKTVDGPKD
ncbi:hypothetical protein [Cryptosporangium sp. NPDC051539]|uniref:hypothetical protein n=1 Tax=Cryptosporangium sp. NPDC051539 TaxID=3363962 RepID=UPI003794925E